MNGFLDHRHDQSLFSLLCKKNNFIPYSDITDYAYFPEAYLQSEIRLPPRILLNSNFPGTILSVRGSNPFFYLIKFFVKKFLKNALPKIYNFYFNKRKVFFNYYS
ncbi:hypothetical protein D0X99_20235 [Algoriphagus lacus]|uniref:Uncharacterized protein n=2 Tax=Algoriphagus lacus TaxID=2056311 RepID=A0A418PLK6_9BACT|nr:hypothetical protein D0X99_20235 [Algoriphagus lacus]